MAACGPMRRATALLAISVIFIGGAAIVGCSGGIRVVFHPTDRTFIGRPGPRPRVYLPMNLDELPKTGMRSVGLIEVTVPESSGIERAIDAATEKGRELGCWILIEHSAFATVQTRASLDHGAVIILAHGPGPHVGPSASPPVGKRTAQFHCVVEAAVHARRPPQSMPSRSRADSTRLRDYVSPVEHAALRAVRCLVPAGDFGHTVAPCLGP